MTQISRQVRRQAERAEAQRQSHAAKVEARTPARRALLRRQSAREKSGFYEGTASVAGVVSPSRSRISSRKVKKGKPFGRILRTKTIGEVEFQFHATKGFRFYRAS